MLFSKTPVLLAFMLMASAQFPAVAETAPDEATMKLGERKFMLCLSCHSADQDGGNRIGPNLWGLFGRKAGTAPDFKYSDAIKNSGVIWSDETLDKWIASPYAFIPGTKMAFRGIESPDERQALIAYLKQKTTAPK